jgi:hypothetical protein
VTIKQYYHTQETRGIELTSPIKCTRDDAWLGEAYYFWFDLEDAEDWGNSSKRGKGYYDIYQSEINIENVLDTVFNEEHYNFWFKQIEKIARIIMAKTKIKPTLKELNDYLKERGTWNELHGIRFQDLPVSPDRLLIKPIEYKSGKIRYFQYRKRIQLAVYNSEIISKFTRLATEKCI